MSDLACPFYKQEPGLPHVHPRYEVCGSSSWSNMENLMQVSSLLSMLSCLFLTASVATWRRHTIYMCVRDASTVPEARMNAVPTRRTALFLSP